MSQVRVQGNASGTGILTVTSPNTNSNYTLTLPAQTGTVLTNASTTGFPAGSVLQVVQGTFSTQVSTTSTSFVATGLTASITPSATTSKILCIVSGSVVTVTTNSIYLTLYKNGANVLSTGGFVETASGGGVLYVGVPFQYLDSPASTSSQTYAVYYRVSSSTGYFNSSGGQTSVITLMEIAA